MNELQKVEFEELKAIVNICDKYDIKYFLINGSALGAAKYKGFIPWDDDCDIGIPRREYEKFIKIAPKELEKYYFLQNSHTEDPCPRIFSKLRDSRTTFIEKSAANLKVNHGVYIDIFPLDDYPENKEKRIIVKIKKWIYTHQIACVYVQQQSFFGKMLNSINLLLGYDKKINKVVNKLEKMLIKVDEENNECYCNYGGWKGLSEITPKSVFNNGTFAEFEGLKVRIPEKYDEYLTQKYGDWRADLPDDQKYGHHFASVIDLEKPYTEYINKN